MSNFPAPNGAFPVPGKLAAADPSNPQLLAECVQLRYMRSSRIWASASVFANDWSLFSRIDYHDIKDDRFYLSLNWNRFDSPSGMITAGTDATFRHQHFGQQLRPRLSCQLRLESRLWQRSAERSACQLLTRRPIFNADRARGPRRSRRVVLLRRAARTYRRQQLELGNAGFAGGRTNEAFWQLSDHVSYLRGKHTLKFGAEFTVHARD